MKKRLLLGIVAALSLGVSMPAAAHVRLDPTTTVVGRQVYNVRVPNEKSIPTTKVRIVVPEGVEVTGILPIPGWTHTEKRVPIANNKDTDTEQKTSKSDEATTRISEITWTGGKIAKGEYMIFGINTNYEGAPAKITWKAYQTYSDGTVVPWDGSSDNAEAPTVEVLSETKLESLENTIANLQQDNQKPESFKADLNTWLAGSALLLAIGALMLQIKTKANTKTR